MNLSASDLQASALRLLGITDESHLKAIAELLRTPATSGDELSAILPDQLVAIAPVIVAPDYLERLRRIIPVPVADEVFKAAHEIYKKELGQLTESPGFLEGRKSVLLKMKAGQQTSAEESQDETGPVASVGGVASTAFLMGFTAPYMPVLKVSVTDTQSRELWSEMLNWFDMMFLSQALLKQVSEHAQNTQEMIKSGMIHMLEPSKIKEVLTDLRATLDTLEKTISPVDEPVKTDG